MLGPRRGAGLTWVKGHRLAPRFDGAMRTPADPETLRREELEQALRQLQRGQDPVSVLERFSQRLTNKLLHVPLKAAAG